MYLEPSYHDMLETDGTCSDPVLTSFQHQGLVSDHLMKSNTLCLYPYLPVDGHKDTYFGSLSYMNFE